MDKSKTVCDIGPHHCALVDGQTGLCRARAANGGHIISLSYGRLTSLALDPVEKKPFARWHSGHFIISVGSFGCNLRCPFCQNDTISQVGQDAETETITPAALVELAERYVPRGNVGIAFTYNEPLIGFEFVKDTATLAKEHGLATALVTNGYITQEKLCDILPIIDAMNIDLKGWSDEYYRWLGGHIEPVKETIATAIESGCHVEVTTLIVPGKNDSESDMDEEAAWLAALNKDTPLHISRYFPRYHTMDIPATPTETVYRLADIARKHLTYVYTGNC